MSELTKLPNIGPELAKRLELAGIKSSKKLAELGTENAFIRLKTVFPGACHNQLYALEGAIQGIRWHGISKERKVELQEFMKMTQKNL
ncbi:MAG: TfoX/Sxy family protein [Bacteroidales bacterium]|nr:TfoX/Sxy family protein [Bacteroidales bacterium]